MGCGSSGQVVSSENIPNDGHNGKQAGNVNHGDHDDGLPTVVLPETPVKTKPPVAYEIPIEEFKGNRGTASTPPPHVQRLLQPPSAGISLPHIEGKLAEAEMRRQTILQQRATSAQKRTQKNMKSMYDTNDVRTNQYADGIKHVSNTLTIPPESGLCEDKNIS
ncbi:uncharacterized protein [Battus philenor]|uniref:uncharacterized protein n=1 Tax=Battus philenor TaxID=42288 RepID=UPI0035D10ED7